MEIVCHVFSAEQGEKNEDSEPTVTAIKTDQPKLTNGSL